MKRMSLQAKWDVRCALELALDQIKQYQQYAEAMRSHGRGFSPSSEFTESSVLLVIESAMRKLPCIGERS